MKFLGLAPLITFAHASGAQAKGWDLKPYGGPVVALGLASSPLPPPGSTVDRGSLRLDTYSGEVWMLETGDPPPALGPTGTVGGFWSSPLVLAFLVPLVLGLFRSR